LANIVSKLAVVYGVLWLLTFWFQNLIFSTIISGFGVALLVILAIGVDNLFGEKDDNEAKLKIELESLRKEIKELKEK
jgi:hypothetical protein